MAWDNHDNFGKGTLTNAPGLAGTSFVLSSGDGAGFSVNQPVTIAPPNEQPDSLNAEIGYVTAVSTDTLTVTRAQQGTSAVNAVVGYMVYGSITAKALTDIETEVDTKLDSNTPITGATKTKITYDADGLVTAGADATQDDIGDGTTYKQYSATEKTKLAGIASGATANDTDANLKARANHTGTQTASTISDFSTATDARITNAVGTSVQAFDADLGAVAGLSSNGSIHRTGAGTAAVRTLTGTANLITVTNGDGVSGNPTITVGSNVYTVGGTDASVADGGTGRSTSTTAYGLIAAGTTATGAHQTISPGTSGHILKSNGASALASFSAGAKGDVGLGNVDNTSDANKPVSTATQSALDAKVNGTTYALHTADTAAHGATGAIVGTTNTQTLTNKDLSSSTNVMPTGAQVQMVSSGASAVATGTTVIPFDDTIPQNTEGDQYLSVTITPKSTSNILKIEVSIFGSHSASGADTVVALFQDTTANALAVTSMTSPTANYRVTIPLIHTMTAGTTSATTFKVRAGGHIAGTWTLNGVAGSRNFGAINKSYITVTETKG